VFFHPQLALPNAHTHIYSIEMIVVPWFIVMFLTCCLHSLAYFYPSYSYSF